MPEACWMMVGAFLVVLVAVCSYRPNILSLLLRFELVRVLLFALVLSVGVSTSGLDKRMTFAFIIFSVCEATRVLNCLVYQARAGGRRLIR